ncbi:MAG: hypothetical protein PHH98_02985 [Candidatus Gracilibacteria bacterium]|nr:hypothetical protein [Candidatus Gracilibacteria bacterium]
MIKVHKNDSIVDIIIKIKNNNEKELIIEFPFGHAVLHNYTSLKIIKTKAAKRELIIITNDKTAKKIGKNLGIKYSITDNPDLIEHNYTFFEYFLYTFKSYFREIKDVFLQRNHDSVLGKYNKKYGNGKIGFFISFIFISLFLLLFIFYFAVNKTYIYITPEIEVKTKAKNFVFTEMKDDEFVLDENTIKLKKIQKIVSLTDKFGSSGISEKTVSNSRGKVTLYNYFGDQIDLIANTRIETMSGVTFLLEGSVSVPASSISGSGQVIPGKIDAYAVSRNHDSEGKISGLRANIPNGTKLELPGLKTDKDKLSAIAISDFKGANDNYTKVITKEDIENAKLLLRGKIEAEALKQLKDEITETNKTNNVEFEILGIDNVIKYSDFEIFGIENLKVGDEVEAFELGGTIKISTYSYNKDLLISKMRNDIKNSILSDVEEILEINSNSLRIVNILWTENNPYSIKATAQVEVSFIHNFLSKSNNYIDRLKSVVAGLDKDEAIKILLNNSKISNAKIDTKPFFIKNVSKIQDNIIFKVNKN